MTTKSKVFGGLNLGDIARGVKERGEVSPFDRAGVTKPVVPAADLALSGRSIPSIERETVLSVDPRLMSSSRHAMSSALASASIQASASAHTALVASII